MKKIASLLVLALFGASGAFADVLTLQPGAGAIDGVNVSSGGLATVDGRESTLVTVGAGLRSKKVAILNVKVYVAQLLLSDASLFVRSESAALDSLDREATVAIQLSFLRGVDAGTVQNSFAEALDANGINKGSPEMKAFLDAVSAGGDAVSGKSLTIVGEKLADGTEVVTYENTQGESVSVVGNQGFVKKVFAIWLGNPSDKGIAVLKKSLIGV